MGCRTLSACVGMVALALTVPELLQAGEKEDMEAMQK